MPDAVMRLDKFFSSQSILSRKETAKCVRQGRITVNGEPARACDQKISPGRDRIALDGQEVGFKQHVYLMLNKPAGVVSATEDSRYPTVLDLVPPELYRKGLFPAGRLDKDTEGFVLLTDDGEFAHAMLSPRHHVPKVYEAVLDGPVGPREQELFAAGMTLASGEVCAPAGLRVLSGGGHPLVEVTLVEGKYHQIKRMFGAVGRRVEALKRVKIGGLILDKTLQKGDCRALSPQEVEAVISRIL